MSGFKLLAIRPVENCSTKFRKKLIAGKLYKFYQDCVFYNEEMAIISDKDDYQGAIYSIQDKSHLNGLFNFDSNLPIHVSCIVGKNGSGKSTLIELFFLAVYLCDYKSIIQHKKKTEDQLISIENDWSFSKILDENYNHLTHRADYSTIRFFEGLSYFRRERVCLEFFYELDKHFYKVIIDTNRADEENWYTVEKLKNEKFVEEDDQPPIDFYSIALNYSIHSLNSGDMELWIESIFHKNDAYQTPLVINPKRDEGTIDVNNEKDLQKSRLLVNTMDINQTGKKLDPLFNEKEITQIVFRYIVGQSKFSIPGSDKVNLDIPLLSAPFNNVNEEAKFQLEKIQEIFEIKPYSDCSWIEKEAYGYIAYKVKRIKSKHPTIFNSDFSNMLQVLKTYDSHITYKLRQAINFIQLPNYIKTQCEEYKPDVVDNAYGAGIDGFSFKNFTFIDVPIINFEENFNEQIYSGKASDVIDQIQFLPPPLFDYDFHFSDDPNNTFEFLSSGEKQQIYSIHTIMYHIRNVSSVQKGQDIRNYRNINIILDEIELYFHPEMQRHFVSRLLNGIEMLYKYLNGRIDSVNVLLATHSPFILSDIPSSNILRLIDGKPEPKGENTFGANIHDLLANDFFLEKGFMGEFAKIKINDVITNMRHDKIKWDMIGLDGEKDKIELAGLKRKQKELNKRNESLSPLKCREIIDLVGEPMLYMSLMELYSETYKSDGNAFIEDQIKKLKKLKKIIKK